MSELHTNHQPRVPFQGGQHPGTVRQPWANARLRDGGPALLRPLERGEAEPLLAVFDGMSADSRALRYLTGLSRLPAAMLAVLTDVDDDQHVAWVASVAGDPVGAARYVRDLGCTTTAELAFEVVDRHQGRGLGSLLDDAVTTVAAARGVRRIRGTLAPWNTPSRPDGATRRDLADL